MAESEFRVGAFAYRARQMPAKTQFAVLAKISPLFAAGLTELMPFIQTAMENGLLKSLNMPLDEAMKAASPAAKALAAMPDSDRDFIIASCLSICTRKEDGKEGWGPIWNDGAGASPCDDINTDISVMLKIILGVLRVTFTRFFPESLSGLIGGA